MSRHQSLLITVILLTALFSRELAPNLTMAALSCGSWTTVRMEQDQRLQTLPQGSISANDCQVSFQLVNNTPVQLFFGSRELGGYTMEARVSGKQNTEFNWDSSLPNPNNNAFVLPSVARKIMIVPKTVSTGGQITIDAHLTASTFAIDSSLYLLKVGLALSPVPATCMAPEEQLSLLAIKSSYIIEKTAGYALARQFGRAASELKNVGEVFFHQAAIAAAGQDMRLGCIVDSLKSFGAQPALVAKLAIDYGFWIYPVILDHFKYQNTPTAFSLVYAAAPAQELLRPLGFERGWVAFMKVPRPQRPPGQEEPYELWLLQSNGTRRIFIDRGPVVTFAGWLNDEEIVYAVSSDTSDTSNTDQSGVLYTSNIRTGVRHKLVSFVPNPKSAEFWLMQHGVRVSPDGKTIAYMDSNGIMLYELATGRERRLIQNINGGAFSKRSSSFFAPRWSPDGRSLLIMQIFYEWAADIVLDGLSVPGRMTVVSESGGPMGSMGVWSPDGRRIAYILGGNGFDLGIGLVNGQDASPVSVILLGNVGDREEFVSHFGGAADATLASAPILGGEISSPRWSSDGKALAFCGTQQFRNIYTITFEGSTVKRLTDVQGDACSPFWSSDGEWIVYAVNESSREQEEGIWIVQSDGREHRKLYP